jgi:hypothetical protein
MNWCPLRLTLIWFSKSGSLAVGIPSFVFRLWIRRHVLYCGHSSSTSKTHCGKKGHRKKFDEAMADLVDDIKRVTSAPIAATHGQSIERLKLI